MSPRMQKQSNNQPVAQYAVLILSMDGQAYDVVPKKLRVAKGGQIQWHCNLAEGCQIMFPSSPFFPMAIDPLSSSGEIDIPVNATPGSYSYTVHFADGTRVDPEIIIEGPVEN